MMLDIFSSFDPHNSLMNSFSPKMLWMICMSPALLIFPSLWSSHPTHSWMKTMSLSMMYYQINRTQGKKLSSSPLLLTSLFSFIIMINFTGMIPYLLPPSSHLMMTMSLGIPLWASLIISATQHNPKTVAANLLPGGAPLWLNSPLIIIETVSIMVRPITLTVRLAANMSAGHIILGLSSIYAATAALTNMYAFIILFTTQTAYTMFEFAICLVQAYIFCLLLSLYSDEHP